LTGSPVFKLQLLDTEKELPPCLQIYKLYNVAAIHTQESQVTFLIWICC